MEQLFKKYDIDQGVDDFRSVFPKFQGGMSMLSINRPTKGGVMSKEDKIPKVKDVQRGVWNAETVSKVKYMAAMGKHRIRAVERQEIPKF